MGKERKVYKVFDWKARRRETIWKTKAWMGGCDWLVECRVDPVGSE
jgi:hypothetical protein